MTAPDTFDRFILDAQTELRRAYAGSLPPAMVPAAVAGALHYARGNQKRLQRLANPVGYLYRVGAARTSVPASGFVAWSHDGEPSADSDLAQAMAALPALEGSAVWLVRGCGWTNVQAAEALGISSPALAAAARAGHDQLGEAIGATGLDARLRALAAHRLTQIPALSETTPPGETGTAPEITVWPERERRMGRRTWRLLSLLVVLALLGGVVAWILAADGSTDDDRSANSIDSEKDSPMYDRSLDERSDWTAPLSASARPGAFALAEVGTGEAILVAERARAVEPLIPASTFKLLHALIVLETGTLESIDSVVPWDGKTREIDAWNQDHTLGTAIAESAVWVFQTLAPRIGPDAMAAHVAAAGYGNADIGGDIQSFWLDGALRTSAVDQLAFLEALATGALPFDAAAQVDVVASMPTQRGDTYILRHKTGTALASDQPVAWLVGIVETAQATYVFAYNVALTDGAGDMLESVPSPAERLAVVEALLASAGVIEE